MNRKRSVIILCFFVIIVGVIFFGVCKKNENKKKSVKMETDFNFEEKEVTTNIQAEPVAINRIENDDIAEKEQKKREIGLVPFQVQAPGGKWDEPLFQNGCEEASIIMAARWVNGLGELNADAMTKEIRRVSMEEKRIFGHSIDTSIEDTHKILKQVFEIEHAKVIELRSIDDFSKQLLNGNLIVVNVYGRALKNPYFTSPGPITHMLVVIGYDAEKKQVITNDPGTKNGRGYRYDKDIFWNALWNYPTGEEHPLVPKSTGGPVRGIAIEKY